MKLHPILSTALAAAAVALAAATAQAVSVDLVTVGNAGNEGEATAFPGYTNMAGDTYAAQIRIAGGVPYTYQIGKCEITAGQYVEFLNAVAKADPYGLYHGYMSDTAMFNGCNIQRVGNSGTYSYSVPSDWTNRPVNYVSWGDAARFVNWLSNGQPTAALTGNPALDAALTEDGSYYLNGATSDVALMAVTRKATATWVIPTENEWFKAGYYDPNKGGMGVGGYWKYPTKSDTQPSNILSLTGSNNANYYGGDYTVGAPFYRTLVGAFENSPSPYGTFDQAGNVLEWDETVIDTTVTSVEHPTLVFHNRGYRGGSFDHFASELDATLSNTGEGPSYAYSYVGFRVAYEPEPGSVALLLAAAIALLVFRRRWKR